MAYTYVVDLTKGCRDLFLYLVGINYSTHNKSLWYYDVHMYYIIKKWNI